MKEEEEKDFDNARDILCPFCEEPQYIELCDGGTGLVTYHGEESVEWDCHDCEKTFHIKEQVNRYWTVSKEI